MSAVDGDAEAPPPTADASTAVYDARPAPPPFEPAAAPDAIPAYNELDAKVALRDAGAEPAEPAQDSGTPPVSLPAPDCLMVQRGETIKVDAELAADRQWLRIDPADGCPAMLVTADEVAYAPHVLCPADEDRMLTLSMRGTDMLSAQGGETVADPMLAVYGDEASLHDDPFDCLAVNDEGMFDGVPSNSARIEGLFLPAGMGAVVIATSFEPPEQHGVGLFQLEVRAE